MLLEGAASTALLETLKEDVSNEAAWKALVESQTAPALRLDVLERAVATVPASLALRRLLVEEHLRADSSRLLPALHATLSLFPDQGDLWDLLLDRFPSTNSFTAALRHVDNARVWPAYTAYLLRPDVPEPERSRGLCHFLEFAPDRHADVLAAAVAAGCYETAEQLLLRGRPAFAFWQPVVERSSSPAFLRAALNEFPNESALIVPRLAAALPFAEARHVVLAALNTASLASFPAIFRAATSVYETAIQGAFAGSNAHSEFSGAKMLAELGNLLRKRPMLLSDAAVRAHPHSTGVWLHRASLWQDRPHIAADVLETALETVNPITADGDVSDLYIRYAELLIANGSADTAQKVLGEAAVKPHMTAGMRAKLYAALARADPAQAASVLETALQLPLDDRQTLWMQYFAVLAEQVRTGKGREDALADAQAADAQTEGALSAATKATAADRLLTAFSRACIAGDITMRMCLTVAQAFAPGSANQVAVFDQSVALFPVPVVLPLWKQYFAALHLVADPTHLRGLFHTALAQFAHNKPGYEELVLQYFRAERSWPTGSLVLARQKLVHTLQRTVDPRVWAAYIETLGDVGSRRAAYEQAINTVGPGPARRLALEFAALEADNGQPARAHEILDFAQRLAGDTHDATDDTSMDTSMDVQFVPAMS